MLKFVLSATRSTRARKKLWTPQVVLISSARNTALKLHNLTQARLAKRQLTLPFLFIQDNHSVNDLSLSNPKSPGYKPPYIFKHSKVKLLPS